MANVVIPVKHKNSARMLLLIIPTNVLPIYIAPCEIVDNHVQLPSLDCEMIGGCLAPENLFDLLIKLLLGFGIDTIFLVHIPR